MSELKRLPLSPIKSPSKRRKLHPTMIEEVAAASKLFEDESFDFDDGFDFSNVIIPDVPQSNKSAAKRNDNFLSSWSRCIIKEVARDAKTFDLILTVNDANDNNLIQNCCLRGPWSHTKVCVGDIASILAVWDDTLRSYVINGEEGFIVINPDYLVSGTTVVGSLFCRRKSVLQDKFHGIDAGNKIMLIGSLVHELFQIVLTKGLKTFEEIEKAGDQLTASPNTIFSLYSSDMTTNEAKEEILKFIPNILSFIDQYVDGNSENSSSSTFQGRIEDIQDIEENLWLPRLGIKGKVDVSVNVRKRGRKPELMPLELKTGRASFSMEHKGQLILYEMMLSEIGKSCRSGLLLYLRDGIMKEINSTRNEQRDLIILRNDLTYYLAKDISDRPVQGDKNTEMLHMELPEPISHPTACSKCPYKTVCSSFLVRDKSDKLSDSHPMVQNSKNYTSHLESPDLDYFTNWCGLIALEEQEGKKGNLLKTLWTETADRRQKRGRCLQNLKIQESPSFSEGRFVHKFTNDHSSEDLTLMGFNIGEYVIVSIPTRTAIGAGFVNEITSQTISLDLERNLAIKYPNERFIIDKYESQSGNAFNYTNLGILLDDTESAKRLRDIVVKKTPSTFTKVLPKSIAKDGVDVLVGLNPVQRKAAVSALTCNDYMLIKGLPGTGKTQTLVSIIRLLDLMGKSILITSHTHSAVDNLLIRLKEFNVKFLRLGNESRIHPELCEFSESRLTRNCTSPDDLAKVYSSHNIVGVTCFGSAHTLFAYRSFDVCIVDEATQVFQPTILRPLFYAKKFILVGDPDQLPPLVRSNKARSLGADESLFHRLDSSESTSVLTLQYRMNKTITKLANDFTYDGELKCANENVTKMILEFPKIDRMHRMISSRKWISRVLERHIDQSVFVLNTGNCLERSARFADCKKLSTIEQCFAEADITEEPIDAKFKCTNYCEAAICFALVRSLLAGGCEAVNIGIIAPYRAQVELISRLAEKLKELYQKDDLNLTGLEVNTVDQYQGRDKDVIIYSCTKTGTNSSKSRENQILEDKRRLTVAITRSKRKLIVVGDEENLKCYTPFQKMLSKVPSRSRITLEDGKFGFDWDSVLAELNAVKL